MHVVVWTGIVDVPEITIVGGEVKSVPPLVIVKLVIIFKVKLAVIVINPPPLNDIIGASVYPLPLLVIAIAVIAPEATVAVAVAPVPIPLIWTFGADVQPVPPVATAIEFILKLVLDKVVAKVGVFCVNVAI